MAGLLSFIKRLRATFMFWKFTLRRRFIGCLPFSAIEHSAKLAWLIRAVHDGRVRASGVARYEAGRIDVGLSRGNALLTMSANVRESLLDERIYAGRALQYRFGSDLRDVALQLAGKIREIKASARDRAVVLSPFHYVSQYANIYVVDEVRRELALPSMSVVSGVPRDIYGEDAAMIPSIRVLHTYDESGSESRGGLGLQVVRALRRDGVVVIFSDVPPFTLMKFPMETVDVTMFGRSARVHNGVFRLGATVNALLLTFYLRFENGRFNIRLFEPIALRDFDAPQRLANDIEAALRENYPHWLYAGHPSAYHFAAAR
ncbi:hypothetical protein [Paraburkholderia sp. J76]|uniref:hypothetical protein n=1 Tax=Paraburkholderia sp. J76 TaxID=2805439 RepID=UPI002ABDABAE|nr:hypothetical protein [Paraburkholderia sp. J76]